MRISDAERWNYKGPVRTVTIEQRSPWGARTTVLEFDESGALVSRSGVNADGSRWSHAAESRIDADGWTEHRVSGVSAYAPPGLDDVAVATHGASLARTRVNAIGAPLETVFQDDSGAELTRVLYDLDPSGRIVRAVQIAGAAFAASLQNVPDTERHQLALALGPELLRVEFTHDDARRVVTTETFIASLPTGRDVKEYNEFGDVVAEKRYDLARGATFSIGPHGRTVVDAPEHAAPSTTWFEYEYDAHHNWTVRRVRDRHSRLTETRSITYYA